MVPSTTPIAANSHFHSSHQGLTSSCKVMIAREGFGRSLGLRTQPRPNTFSSCAFWTILGSCLGCYFIFGNFWNLNSLTSMLFFATRL
jgi:hypothetical protein